MTIASLPHPTNFYFVDEGGPVSTRGRRQAMELLKLRGPSSMTYLWWTTSADMNHGRTARRRAIYYCIFSRMLPRPSPHTKARQRWPLALQLQNAEKCLKPAPQCGAASSRHPEPPCHVWASKCLAESEGIRWRGGGAGQTPPE